MNLVDIIIILVLLMSAIIGFKRGAIKEIVSFIGLVVVFIVAFSLKGVLGNLLCKWLPFFDFAGNLSGVTVLNILFYQLIAFIIIYSLLFGIYSIVLKLSGIIQKLVHATIILWLPSKAIGAIVALITGYITIFVILLVLLIPFSNTSFFMESKIANFMIYDTPILSKSAEGISSSISEVYLLGEDLSKGNIGKNEANCRTLDILLKYNVVDADTAEDLILLDKLDGISGLQEVVEKYQ